MAERGDDSRNRGRTDRNRGQDEGLFERTRDQVSEWLDDDEPRAQARGRRDHPQSWGEANESGENDGSGGARSGGRPESFGGVSHGFGGSREETYGSEGYGYGQRGVPNPSTERWAASNHDHYRRWRDQQIEGFDREYEEFRREREQRFDQDFTSWREQRCAQRSSGADIESGSSSPGEERGATTGGTPASEGSQAGGGESARNRSGS